MAIEIVFETHATTEDNEAGIATGWLPGHLSASGVANSRELGARRRDDGISAVFVSDLARALETVQIALEGADIPVLCDWRLRECDYGELNGAAVTEVHGARLSYLDSPYPSGESWRQATRRVGSFLEDLPSRWEERRVLVVGHLATRFGLECALGGIDLARLLEEEFAWQEGWEYALDSP